MPDVRLCLAAELYPECDLAADIGTDHALLPCLLLKSGRCKRMILTDISPDALNNARFHIGKAHLGSRVDFRLGNGLDPIADDESCGCISVMGMGGRNIAGILKEGSSKLHSAVLVLSAHTDLDLVRTAVMEIGYRFTREEVCLMDGRFYVFFRAEPGREELTDQQIRLGVRLFDHPSPILTDYLRRRIQVLEAKRSGLLSASEPDPDAIVHVDGDISFCRAALEQYL